MARLNKLSMIVAGCLLVSGSAGALAQGRDWDRDRDRGGWDRGDRDGDRDRDWRDRRRGGDDDDDRGWRGRDQGWRGRFDRDRDCYFVTRRYVDRDGDIVIRRRRVCE